MYVLGEITNIKTFHGYVCGDVCNTDDETYPPYKWSSDDIEFANNCGFIFIRLCDLIPSNRDNIIEKVKSRLSFWLEIKVVVKVHLHHYYCKKIVII